MKANEVVEALGALAHEHRLAVYRMLVEAGLGGLSAGAIAERLGVPPSSLTFHTQALVRAGLVHLAGICDSVWPAEPSRICHSPAEI